MTRAAKNRKELSAHTSEKQTKVEIVMALNFAKDHWIGFSQK